MRSRDGGYDVSPWEETHRAPRSGRPNSHAPIQAERSTLDSRALPLSRNEAIRDRPNRPLRQRPLNRKTLSDPPTLLTPPQRTTNPPEHTIERSKRDSQTNTEENNARVDDEPFHREAHGTSASVTTTRKPALWPHTTRVVERTGERDTVAENHFQSNISSWMGWYAAVSPCHAISHNVNTVLLQCAPNLFNLLLIHTSNANATVNLTVTVLHNFDLKRDTIQAENYLPAQ